MDPSSSRAVNHRLAIKIITAYLKHHALAQSELVSLVAGAHRGLQGLGKPEATVETPRPAVPVRRSVHRDYVVCLECGHRGKVLRQHLRNEHGLDPGAYRERWKLPSDHPITAPGYSTRRSMAAKASGLGRRQQSPQAAPEPSPPPRIPAGLDLDPTFVASLSLRPSGRRTRAPREPER